MNERTFHAKGLAAETGYSRSYVYAAKRAGFQFTHGTRTTVSSFLNWIEEHPRFRTQDFVTNKLAKKNRRNVAA